jgi:hypothetical protein
MRRTNRGTRRVFTITWVVLALMLGALGLRYRKSSAAAHVARPAGAPAQQAPSNASPDAGHHVQPKPASDRNG